MGNMLCELLNKLILYIVSICRTVKKLNKMK